MTFHQVVGAAIVIPLVSLATITVARSLGRWLRRVIAESVSDTIRDIVRADIEHLGDTLGASLDELRATNTRDHHIVESRLGEVTSSIDVQTGRIDALEATVSELAHKEE